MPPKNPNDFYNNTAWTFTDDSDLIDVWATFIVGKEKFKDQFDLGKLPQTRERRRMNGDFTVSMLDVYNERIYPDTISIHESSFDTHGFTVDSFFALTEGLGRKLENLIFLHLRRKYTELYYFDEKGECDFVAMKKDSVIELVQVCYELTADNLKKEMNGLLLSMRFFNLKKLFW